MTNNTLTKTFTFGGIVFTILAGSGFLASQAQATVITNGCAATNQFCTLSELYGGASIQVGDKVFSDWVVVNEAGKPVNASDIQISGIFQDTTAPGIKINALNGAFSVPDFSSLFYDFDFKVTSLGPLIKDFSLRLPTDGYTLNGLGTISIVEIVGTTCGSDNLGGGIIDVGSTGLEVTGEFTPQQMVCVRKSIFISNINLPGEGFPPIGITMIEQRFSQVPEPNSTLSLLALGTLGAASTLKRKLKPSQSSEKETRKVG
ncbi:MAG: PEP-CTERM sorting domain-containing protein [Microcystis sp. LE19-84.1B]|uniref:PEP-CTERM sorting domain-containing protein n=1 Tax=Microcystis sp. LE19-84.1B TaxID=3016438 RepID=UPI0022C39EB4|nr:PEP-CTERM sorting domain-containing protein [Microcystis sp. LE19-84.1B]MCZ8226719.1 PEP-CTERM sorting domain-containing protein [Microcystis sp. LE19-84.1B]